MTQRARHSLRTAIIPADPRNPGEEYLRVELDGDRRAERWILAKAALAIFVVAVLVVIRQVFFV